MSEKEMKNNEIIMLKRENETLKELLEKSERKNKKLKKKLKKAKREIKLLKGKKLSELEKGIINNSVRLLQEPNFFIDDSFTKELKEKEMQLLKKGK